MQRLDRGARWPLTKASRALERPKEKRSCPPPGLSSAQDFIRDTNAAAQVYPLINRGGASAQDILDLMHQIQDEVRTLFGVDLKPEPIFVGF